MLSRSTRKMRISRCICLNCVRDWTLHLMSRYIWLNSTRELTLHLQNEKKITVVISHIMKIELLQKRVICSNYLWPDIFQMHMYTLDEMQHHFIEIGNRPVKQIAMI
jgi:hypothetical protein